MKTTIYVPGDSGALALGADEVAKALATAFASRNLDVRIVRNGSRGLYWLEPMVEVETASGRIAYGPIAAGEVGALVEAGLLDGKPHAKCLGLAEEIPFLKRQTRLTFERCGIVDPRSLVAYEQAGGFAGLQKAVAMTPAGKPAPPRPRRPEAAISSMIACGSMDRARSSPRSPPRAR